MPAFLTVKNLKPYITDNLKVTSKNGFGWNRFVKMVDQVMPKKGTILELFPDRMLPSS